MKKTLLTAFCAVCSYASVYTFDEFVNEVYKNDMSVIDIVGEKNAAKYDKAAALALEPLTLEFSKRKIKTDESTYQSETSSMLGFFTRMPWIIASEKRGYEAKEKTLYISEQLQKTAIKSEVKRTYLLFLLASEEEDIYAQKEAAAKRSCEMAKKKFDAGRISKMELARFETELMQSKVDLASASALKEELHHTLSHAVLSHDEIAISDLEFKFYPALSEKLERLRSESLQLKEMESKKQEIEGEMGTYKYSLIDRVEFGVGQTKEATQKSVDFRVSFPLNVTGKNESKIVALRARLDALARKQKVLQDTLSIMAKMESQRVVELEKKIKNSIANEELYKSVFDMTAKGYEGGAVSLFEYLAAKNGYFDSMIKTIAYKKEYVEEIAKLERVFAGVIK